MRREVRGGALRIVRVPGAILARDSDLPNRGLLFDAWMEEARQSNRADFDDLAGRFPDRLVKDAQGRLRWRR